MFCCNSQECKLQYHILEIKVWVHGYCCKSRVIDARSQRKESLYKVRNAKAKSPNPDTCLPMILTYISSKRYLTIWPMQIGIKYMFSFWALPRICQNTKWPIRIKKTLSHQNQIAWCIDFNGYIGPMDSCASYFFFAVDSRSGNADCHGLLFPSIRCTERRRERTQHHKA